jgi:hypothetical protein
MPRYRIYDAHKLATSLLSDFNSFVAKGDFTVDATVEQIKTKFIGITQLVHGHAAHENERIHPLLKQKGSSIVIEAWAAIAHSIEIDERAQLMTKLEINP